MKRNKVLGIIIGTAFIAVVCVCVYSFFIAKTSQGNRYRDVTWNTEVNFTAGDCDSADYSGWCPHNLQYDPTRGKFVYLQCHRNGHMGGFSQMTLCYLDPHNPLDYTELNCPYYVGLGALLVTENGTWYIWTDSMRYTSTDGGETWREDALKTPLSTRYGVYDIDGVFYMGDDSDREGAYWVSVDYGLTWESGSFGVSYKDCEASFCKFQDNIYAFLRTNTTDYACILKLTENGWHCVSNDDLLAYHSDCSPVAFDDCIAIAHISRKDCHLYYTIWDGDSNFITTDLGQIESDIATQYDFHCPTLSFGDGYACIAFMMHTYGTANITSYAYAQNNWIIGTYEPKELLTCEIHTDSDDILKQMTAAYPERAEINANPVVQKQLENSNAFGVSLYDPENNWKTGALSSGDNTLVTVMNGHAVLYSTKAIAEDAQKITVDYIMQHQPYSVIEYHDSTYMCVQEKPAMMMSLQRKNSVIESTAVIDCLPTNEPTKVLYIPAHSSAEITGGLRHAEIAYKNHKN